MNKNIYLVRVFATVLLFSLLFGVSILVAQTKIKSEIPISRHTRSVQIQNTNDLKKTNKPKNKSNLVNLVPFITVLTENATFTTKVSTAELSLPNKQFPNDVRNSVTVLEWSEIRLTCNFEAKNRKDLSVKWMHNSRWVGNVQTPTSVPAKFVDGHSIFIKHMKLKQAATYFCEIWETTPANDPIFLSKSEKLLVGFTPNKVLTISFILTTLVTFIVAFVINWFDLGRYYCNFLDKRLQKVEEIHQEDFSTPASVRASKASLHYSKYDDKSSQMFLTNLMKGAKNAKTVIAEKAETVEFTINLKDWKDRINEINENIGKRVEGVKLEGSKFFEFSIPVPNLFESGSKGGRRESMILEETEQDLENFKNGKNDKNEENNTEIDENEDSQNTDKNAKKSEFTPGALKRIKHNINQYMKNVNIRLNTNDGFITPDFLENVKLKFKFNPDYQTSEAAERLANYDKYTGIENAPSDKYPKQKNSESTAEFKATSTQATRPTSLSIQKPRHNSSNSGGVFTIDVIDDRLNSDNNSVKLTSSVVVTPMEEKFIFSKTGFCNPGSRSMTPTFFVTLDASVFQGSGTASKLSPKPAQDRQQVNSISIHQVSVASEIESDEDHFLGNDENFMRNDETGSSGENECLIETAV